MFFCHLSHYTENVFWVILCFCRLLAAQSAGILCLAVHRRKCICDRVLHDHVLNLLSRCVVNHLRELHHIYNFRTVGYNDEPSRFWGQKVKGQGHRETTCTFPAEGRRSMVCRRRSSSFAYLNFKLKILLYILCRICQNWSITEPVNVHLYCLMDYRSTIRGFNNPRVH